MRVESISGCSFNISTTRLFQVHISNQLHGIVGGVQECFNSLFNLLQSVLGIVFARPGDCYVHCTCFRDISVFQCQSSCIILFQSILEKN